MQISHTHTKAGGKWENRMTGSRLRRVSHIKEYFICFYYTARPVSPWSKASLPAHFSLPLSPTFPPETCSADSDDMEQNWEKMATFLGKETPRTKENPDEGGGWESNKLWHCHLA